MPNTSAFRFVSKEKFQLIKTNNIRNLTPERQLQAIRKWWELNLSKDHRFKLDNDKDLQHFLSEAAGELGIDTTSLLFTRALAAQKTAGAPEPWKSKVEDVMGRKVDVDTNALTQDAQVLGEIKKIVTDKGRGDHGNTKLSGSNADCLHWRAGSLRIFGNMKPTGIFTFVGVGRHNGAGNSKYKLDLVTGGTATAETG